MIIINTTPHPVNVYHGVNVTRFPPSATTIRLMTDTKPIGKINGITLVKSTVSEVVDLPDEIEGTWLITSSIVAMAVPERGDLIVPYHFMRDGDGNIIGCQSFASYSTVDFDKEIG